MSKILTVRHLAGSLAGRSQRVALQEGQVVRLGRGDDNDIKFSDSADDSVSGTHAELSLENGRLYLEDQRSSNGTFVNGAPCPPFQKVVVLDGSRVRLAQGGPEMQLTFEATGAIADRPSAATAAGSLASGDRATAPSPKVAVGRETLLQSLAKAQDDSRQEMEEAVSRSRKASSRWIIGGLVAAMLVACVGVGYAIWRSRQDALASKEEMATTLLREKNIWEDVERKVGPAVVQIRCRYRLRYSVPVDGRKSLVIEDLRGQGDGSGVLIRPGLILTALHVVEPWKFVVDNWDELEEKSKFKAEYDQLEVQFPSYQPIRATLVAGSAEHDLALLQVQETAAPAVGIGKTNADVRVTQPIAVLGYPGELGQYDLKVRNLSGAGSSVKSITEVNPTFVLGRVAQPLTSTGEASHYLVFDGSVGPGNSGGPVIDENGDLVGIVALQFQRKGTPFEVMGEEFATLVPMEAGNLAVSPDDIHAFLRAHGIL